MKSSLTQYQRPKGSGRWYWHLSWYENGKRQQRKTRQLRLEA